jgi:membrane protease YdiL (CAAX protease family)
LVLRGLTENYDTAQRLELAVYVISAAMLAVARTSFREFRIDRLTLILFIVFGTVLRIPSPSEVTTPSDPIYYAYGLIALALAIVVIRSRQFRGRWARTNWRWLVLGLFLAVVLGLFLATVASVFSRLSIALLPARQITTGAFFLTFLSEMGHSAILEEPAFRGLLWGYLEQRGWHPASIWQFQAALFWLAHLRYIDTPFTFWIAVPAGGLLLGWLSWKSKSISASLLAHAAYNSLGALF